MKNIVAGLILNTFAVSFRVAQGATPEGSTKLETSVAKEIDSYLTSLVAENKLSGVAVVARDGATIASKAGGIANKATGAPITLNTKFNLGSMNKMFTAVAIAQLAQAKRLSFDDTIGKHLPDYPNKEVADKVTIHQLLTHTSGMGMYWNDKFMAQREKLVTVAAHLPLFASDPLLFAPGEKFQYSNSGYMVLGAIIEKVSGQDYYSYVQEHIYKPAGMTETGFYEPGKEIPNLAIGYAKMGPDGKPLEEARDNTNLREVRGGPAGGGYSTAGDLVKFHTALRATNCSTRNPPGLSPQAKWTPPALSVVTPTDLETRCSMGNISSVTMEALRELRRISRCIQSSVIPRSS
jgi:D-alanyl-D-alanine carboxypeptidase